MIYRILVRMIERGDVEGIEEKCAVFLAANRLDMIEYRDLMAKLGKTV